jgi:hypothetical protein
VHGYFLTLHPIRAKGKVFSQSMVTERRFTFVSFPGTEWFFRAPGNLGETRRLQVFASVVVRAGSLAACGRSRMTSNSQGLAA